MLGRTRRERLITAGTVIALGLAIVAVIALTSNGDEDEYIEQADGVCVESKQALATVAERVSESGRQSAEALALYRGAVAEIAADWRSRLAALDPPPDRQEAAADLEEALAGVEAEAAPAGLAEPGGASGGPQARLPAAGGRAEQAIEALGLEACAEGGLGIGRLETR
jgi:hypothetical protein